MGTNELKRQPPIKSDAERRWDVLPALTWRPDTNAADASRLHAKQVEQAVREAAYFSWVQAGKPSGDGVQFWLDAERALLALAPSDETPAEDVVEKASRDSFPASDAPGWISIS